MCRSVGSSANMSATRTLVDLCLEVTGSKLARDVDASVSLFDLGLTEAQVPLLCTQIKKEMGVSISAEDLLSTQEIGAIAAMLKRSAGRATNSASRSTKALPYPCLFPQGIQTAILAARPRKGDVRLDVIEPRCG